MPNATPVALYMGPAPRPQLDHTDPSYQAALARCVRAAPGATSGAALQHLVVAADGFRVPARKPGEDRVSMEYRVLGHLTEKACPVGSAQLNISVGAHASTAASRLALAGRIQGRIFKTVGRAGCAGQYLALGLAWPPLPPGAYGVRYATRAAQAAQASGGAQ
jgi:hypothetical protein